MLEKIHFRRIYVTRTVSRSILMVYQGKFSGFSNGDFDKIRSLEAVWHFVFTVSIQINQI